MIGVAIPCYKYHIPVLKRCLESIEAQTQKPNFVVVSCSSSKTDDIPLSYYNNSFPLKILVTEKKLNAAENRNRAAKALIEAGCTILSFFDCDDEMHPQRIEMILKAWKFFPKTQILLHSFFYKPEELSEPYPTYTKIEFLVNKLKKSPTGCAVLEGDWQARIHHSQVTVSEEIVKTILFPEESSVARREDSLFCGNVLSLHGIQSIYLRNSLSKYYEEGMTHAS